MEHYKGKTALITGDSGGNDITTSRSLLLGISSYIMKEND